MAKRKGDLKKTKMDVEQALAAAAGAESLQQLLSSPSGMTHDDAL